jgi:hypothetical protein
MRYNTQKRYIKILVTFFLLILFSTEVKAQNYVWSGLGNYSNGFGVNGNVYAVCEFNGSIIAAGGFTNAGSVSVSNIAAWNGTNWSALGSGLSDTVYSLEVYNNELYAGGRFLQAGSQTAYRIAKWNGSSWSPVGMGADGEVKALKVFNSSLIAGGEFSNIGSSIASWNGSSWSQLGSGMDDDVFALTIYNGYLIAAGRFDYAGGIPASMIASWNGSSWTSLSSYTDERIHSVGVHNSQLIAGGRFSTIGGTNANYIAAYNGSSWSAIGSGLDDRVFAIGSVNGNLVAGGSFKYAGSIYVDRIAMWNGSSWQRMSTGMNNKVNAIFVKDTLLYAGGEFITAGGKFVNHISLWSKPFATRHVSGLVRYADNNQIVSFGTVIAYRMDYATRELIIVDSTRINSGNYDLPGVTIDTLFIMSVPDDELDYVPTYHPSTIDWASAVKVYPSENLTNININVFRITQEPKDNLTTNIGGYVYLNFLPPQGLSNPLPFKSGSIIYAKQGSIYRKFAVSTQTEQYTINALPPGNYEIFVNRIGYTSSLKNIIVNTSNLDTINFTLDTISILSVKQISSNVPSGFVLKQNYPNPFNPVTKIGFLLSSNSNVRLSIYNILGEEVAVLASEDMKAGSYEVVFNAVKLSSGIYFYKLTAISSSGNYSETKKMILIK